MTLTETQARWIAEASKHIRPETLIEITQELVNVPSPTGEEGPLARVIVQRLNDHGLNGREQALDHLQSNAIGSLTGEGRGPTLLLYSPIDTVTSNNPAEDLPWAAAEMPPEMIARAELIDGAITGLGAQNPKGHAACVLAAAEAIKAAGVPLQGNLQFGFGAGGMPTNARPGMRADSGHGVGCDRMVREIGRPDYAVIAKSGWSVSWEEVGLAWYEVKVFGTHTYVGSRHLIPYTNAIVRAGEVIQHLEQWFEGWSERHRSGLVAPQGVVSFIESGWERMPAFTPAMCRFRLDLRLSPRISAEDADRELRAELAAFAAKQNIQLVCHRLVAIPGTSTDYNNPIIRRCVEAWETIENRPHVPVAGLSGGTDANILRAHGVPTARIGLPKAAAAGQDFQRGMNTVAIADLLKLTHHLVRTAIAVTC